MQHMGAQAEGPSFKASMPVTAAGNAAARAGYASAFTMVPGATGSVTVLRCPRLARWDSPCSCSLQRAVPAPTERLWLMLSPESWSGPQSPALVLSPGSRHQWVRDAKAELRAGWIATSPGPGVSAAHACAPAAG